MAKKNRRKKEEIAEDCCFVCKDGGLLMVCEYKDCLKAYHTHCVGRDDSFVETGYRWTCGWHSCFICHKTSKFQCFCCPKAVCGRCICDSEFACVRGKKGFCNHCVQLAKLIEENVDVDIDGVKIDFRDRDTYEFFFKEYWQIIKEKEGLTSKHLHSADSLLKKNRNYRGGSDSNETGEGEGDDDLFEEEEDEESHLIVSDYEDQNDKVENKAVGKRKRSMGKISVKKKKEKSKKKEFVGWASRSLLEFLASISKDSTKELSQYDVSTIITDYCREQKLFDPSKKKKVICDERLQSLLGRKSVNKNGIYNLLTAHFAENFQQSEEDEFGCSSEERDESVLLPSKRQRKLNSDGKSSKELTPVVTPVVKRSCFASIIVENIKLVYLKRSLVEELLKQPETFEGKVMGSFVRIKSDPNDYLQKNTHQLVQVKGMKRASTNGETLLQVSNRPKDVSICRLSDDNFSKEECDDLLQRVKDGLLRKLTVWSESLLENLLSTGGNLEMKE
ncbi:zinc finger CCCH domain-containing protein 19-like isoform X2 [Fagus crenata]